MFCLLPVFRGVLGSGISLTGSHQTVREDLQGWGRKMEGFIADVWGEGQALDLPTALERSSPLPDLGVFIGLPRHVSSVKAASVEGKVISVPISSDRPPPIPTSSPSTTTTVCVTPGESL